MLKSTNKFKKISILIPVYNEQSTIKLIIKKVLVANILGFEFMKSYVVDDCSSDKTWAEIHIETAFRIS